VNDEPTAALVIIGAEILSGKVTDQNTPFLIRALRARGIDTTEVRVISDHHESIVQTVKTMADRSTYVFTTGGIGPTHDDITMEAVANAFGRSLVRHDEILERLRARYGNAINDAHHKLAEVPQGADVILGRERVLPVVRLENVFIFPGVPSLVRICFDRIAATLDSGSFYSRALHLSVSETVVAQTLRDLQEANPDVAIGSYPRFDDAPYRVKITIDSRNDRRVESVFEALQRALDPQIIVPEPDL